MLIHKQILNAVAESLLESGRCPYDSTCRYGRGISCVASDEEIRRRIVDIKEKINKQPRRMAIEVVDNRSNWHCENVWTVVFVDPE